METTYKKPKNLLTFDNAKTIKGEKFNYKTAILYLSPYKQNSEGKNLCSHASPACIFACLNTAGMGIFSNVQNARINKTNYFLKNRKDFLMQLDNEIFKLSKKYGEKLAIRLNGTSDIPFENLRIESGQNLFEIFPDVQFYDYTKIPHRFNKNNIPNYHLTFSVSEEDTNRKTANWIYNNNLGNVAVVLHEKLYNDIFTGEVEKCTYNHKGKVLNLFNGDLTDLRFLDAKNHIVCLKAKGKAKKDTSGFVIKDILELFETFA